MKINTKYSFNDSLYLLKTEISGTKILGNNPKCKRCKGKGRLLIKNTEYVCPECSNKSTLKLTFDYKIVKIGKPRAIRVFKLRKSMDRAYLFDNGRFYGEHELFKTKKEAEKALKKLQNKKGEMNTERYLNRINKREN